VRLLFISILILLQSLFPGAAHATDLSANVVYSVDSSTGTGLSRSIVTPISLDARLAGWDLSMTIATANGDGLAGSDANTRRRAVQGDPISTQRAARGLTDVRISAERSVQIGKKISLDLLARATAPTGRVSRGLGDGRKELMLDAGLSGDVGKLSLWAGGARRLRSAVQTGISGRDITEIYGGASLDLGTSGEVRLDYVRGGIEYRGYPRSARYSAEYRKPLSQIHSVTAFVTQDNGAWGKDTRAGISLTWQARLF